MNLQYLTSDFGHIFTVHAQKRLFMVHYCNGWCGM